MGGRGGGDPQKRAGAGAQKGPREPRRGVSPGKGKLKTPAQSRMRAGTLKDEREASGGGRNM